MLSRLSNLTDQGRLHKLSLKNLLEYMKKTGLIVIILIALSTSIMAQWNYTGPTTGISDDWTTHNCIDTDISTGFPVVVFNDSEGAICLKFIGEKWEAVGYSTFQNFPVANIIDFEIDKKNNYILSFYSDPDYKISCIRFDGKEWNYVGSQFITDNYSSSNAFAVDTSGLVYSVFEVSTGISFFKENGNTWEELSTDGLISEGLVYPNLVIDTSNIPVIAYQGYNFYDINCSRFINNKWAQAGNNKISATNPFPDNIKLQTSSNNDYYIAFNDDGAQCFKLNKSSNIWERIGEQGSELEKLNSIESVVTDQESNIYVFSSGIGGDRARCYSFNGIDWYQLGGTAVSESYANSLDMAFSEKQQKLYCIYTDTEISKASVKEYGITTGVSGNQKDDFLKIYPNPSTGVFSIEVPGEKFNLELFDLQGRQLFQSLNNYHTVEVNDCSLKNGIYLVKVVTGETTSSTEKLVIKQIR